MYRPLLASRVRYKVQGIFSFLFYMDGLAPVGLDNSKPGVSLGQGDWMQEEGDQKVTKVGYREMD